MFYARWRERAVGNGKPSSRTLIAYDEVFRSLIAPKLGDRRVGSITRADVEAVVQSAADRSSWRANDALKVIRRLLSAAVGEDVIARNRASRVAAPKTAQDEPWVLSADEVDRLAAAVPERYRALVLVGAYGGLPWSELVALRIDRLDLMRRRVRVEEKVVEAGRLITGEPKTKRSRRWVTLPEFVALELAEYLRGEFWAFRNPAVAHVSGCQTAFRTGPVEPPSSSQDADTGRDTPRTGLLMPRRVCLETGCGHTYAAGSPCPNPTCPRSNVRSRRAPSKPPVPYGERKRRRGALEAWRAEHGDVCPGFGVAPHRLVRCELSPESRTTPKSRGSRPTQSSPISFCWR